MSSEDSGENMEEQQQQQQPSAIHIYVEDGGQYYTIQGDHMEQGEFSQEDARPYDDDDGRRENDSEVVDDPQQKEEEGIQISLDTILELHNIQLQLPIACDFCPKTFRNMDKFDAHMANHIECRFFACQLCNNTYVSWGNLVAHRKACHRSEVISCESCSQRKHHLGLGPVNFPVGDFPIGCEECHEGFTSVIQLYRHYRLRGKHAHKKKPAWEAADDQPQGEEPASTPALAPASASASFTCTVCNTSFFTEEQLQSHVSRLDSEDTSFTCSVCGKRLCSAHVLNAHRRLHPHPSARTYLCWHCGKVLRDRTSYRRHRTLHTGRHTAKGEHVGKVHAAVPARHAKLRGDAGDAGDEDATEDGRRAGKSRDAAGQLSFICEYCGREFTKKVNLQLHVRRHTGERPHVCHVCGKAFYTRQQLAIHTRQHTGERPYSCKVCAKTFTGPTALYVHRKMHSRERPYPCPVCPKTFALAAKLSAHVKMHGHLLPPTPCATPH